MIQFHIHCYMNHYRSNLHHHITLIRVLTHRHKLSHMNDFYMSIQSQPCNFNHNRLLLKDLNHRRIHLVRFKFHPHRLWNMLLVDHISNLIQSYNLTNSHHYLACFHRHKFHFDLELHLSKVQYRNYYYKPNLVILYSWHIQAMYYHKPHLKWKSHLHI